MCGICGVVGEDGENSVARMNAALVHRGPDDSGTYADPWGPAALGARRLSIIDVAGGHQPLGNEEGTVWAVLNGEIYNHPELRRGLRRNGHRFATGCDTEVLVHLYEEYAEDLVHALDGMFAFAIWDARRKRLLLARDRFGEKPLVYRCDGQTLSFASELTALLAPLSSRPPLDPQAVDDYFVLGYVPGPRTFAAGIEQLPPASRLIWEAADPRPRLERYWSPPAEGKTSPLELEDLAAEAERVLRKSIRGRMLSDVPLGVFLSGGLDSSLVAAIAQQESPSTLKTFTVGYDVGDVNETERARAVAAQIGTDHHELRMREGEVAARVRGLFGRLDQPLADPSLVATNALSEFARGEVTVVVGGEGADELFGGYPRYRWLARAERLQSWLPEPLARLGVGALEQGARGRSRRLIDLLAPKPALERHLDWITDGRRRIRETIAGPALREASSTALLDLLAVRAGDSWQSVEGRFMRLDQACWLPDDVLAKADRASMLASLELRTPYLHQELAELAALTPSGLHTRGRGKAVLRHVLHRRLGVRPSARKLAFGVPIGRWLAGPLQPLLVEHLTSAGRLFEEGWFAPREVRRLVTEHGEGQDHSSALWPLLVLSIWLERN